MLAALMHHIVSARLGFTWICLLLFIGLSLVGSSFAGCVGGIGTTCFQPDECDGELLCCHVGGQFNQGSCETPTVCNELQQGPGGMGGTGGTAGTGGTGGGGGMSGTGGTGGVGGAGGQAGAGGEAGAGGQAGAGGSAGSGGAPLL